MGSDNAVDLSSVGPRRVRMRAAGTAPFTRVEVVRNNQVVFSADPQCDVWKDEWTDTADLADVAFAPTYPGRPAVRLLLPARHPSQPPTSVEQPDLVHGSEVRPIAGSKLVRLETI